MRKSQQIEDRCLQTSRSKDKNGQNGDWVFMLPRAMLCPQQDGSHVIAFDESESGCWIMRFIVFVEDHKEALTMLPQANRGRRPTANAYEADAVIRDGRETEDLRNAIDTFVMVGAGKHLAIFCGTPAGKDENGKPLFLPQSIESLDSYEDILKHRNGGETVVQVRNNSQARSAKKALGARFIQRDEASLHRNSDPVRFHHTHDVYVHADSRVGAHASPPVIVNNYPDAGWATSSKRKRHPVRRTLIAAGLGAACVIAAEIAISSQPTSVTYHPTAAQLGNTQSDLPGPLVPSTVPGAKPVPQAYHGSAVVTATRLRVIPLGLVHRGSNQLVWRFRMPQAATLEEWAAGTELPTHLQGLKELGSKRTITLTTWGMGPLAWDTEWIRAGYREGNGQTVYGPWTTVSAQTYQMWSVIHGWAIEDVVKIHEFRTRLDRFLGKWEWESSGVLLPNGEILTDDHCVMNGGYFAYRLQYGTWRDATVAVQDHAVDLALMQPDALPTEDVTYLQGAALHPPRIGQPVADIGFGLNLSLSSFGRQPPGIVKELDISASVTDYGTLRHMTAATVSAFAGDSGSPILNHWGEIIGLDESGPQSGSGNDPFFNDGSEDYAVSLSTIDRFLIDHTAQSEQYWANNGF